MRKIILLVLCFIVGCKTALAAENDSKIEINFIDNIYSIRKIDDQYYTGEQGIIYINGKIGYCIDPKLVIKNNLYSSSGDFSVMSITDEQLGYLEVVSHFGYGYSGRTANEYYLATQEIIWEYLTDGEMYWTNGLPGDEINIDSYKNEIINSVNQYLAVPDFPSYIETDQYEDIILEDKSGSLKYYRSNLWLGKIDGNKLMLDATTKGTVIINLTKQPLNYGSSYIYMSENSQTIATFGFSSNQTSSISVKYKVKNKVQLTLIKKDSSSRKTIKNKETKIKIYDVNRDAYIKEKGSEIITIKEDGKYTTDTYLEEGTYKIEEIESPIGYELLDEPITFTVHEYDGSMMTIGIYNNPILYSLKIQKLGEVYSGISQINGQLTGLYELKQMNNVIYGLYAKDDILDAEGGIVYEKDSLISEITIKNGIGTLYGLKYGKYYIKELNCPETYILDDNVTEVDFTTEEINKAFKFINNLKKGDILIKKIDNKNNGLEGANFTLKGTQNYLNINFESDSTGKVIIKNIPYDTYFLTEIESPSGYKLDSEEKQLVLNNVKLVYEFVNEREKIPEETSDKEEAKEEEVPGKTPDKEEPKEEEVPGETPDKEEAKEEEVPGKTPDKEEPKEEEGPEEEQNENHYVDIVVENPNTLIKVNEKLFILSIISCISIILYIKVSI